MPPKIDVYTAQTAPAVPNQPLRFLESGEWKGTQITAQVTKLGEKWAEIAGHLQGQSDRYDFMQMKADYEAASTDAMLNLSRDVEVRETPLLFEQKYQEQMRDVVKRISASKKSEGAREQFAGYYQQQIPQELAKARAEGVRLMDVKVLGQYTTTKDRLALEAGEAATPEKFNEKVREFESIVSDTNQLTDVQKAQERIEFKRKVAESNMRFIGSQDPNRMRELAKAGQWKVLPEATKIQVFEHVATQERVAEAQQSAKFKEVQTVYRHGVDSRSSFGLVTASEIDRGRKGLDPIIPDPKDWDAIAQRNEEAPGLTQPDSTQNAETIRLLYRLKIKPSREDAENALKELDALRAQGGSKKTLKAISDTANEIQGDIRTLDAATLAHERQIAADVARVESQERARRGAQIREQDQARQVENQKVHDALLEYRNRLKRRPAISPRLGKLQEIKDDLMRARIESYQRANPSMSPQEVVDSVMGKPEEQSQQAPRSGLNPLLMPRK